MTPKAIRSWCAVARFPSLAPFVAGTVTMPAAAQSHEIEAALVAHFSTFLPPGFTVSQILCGALFFQEDNT